MTSRFPNPFPSPPLPSYHNLSILPTSGFPPIALPNSMIQKHAYLIPSPIYLSPTNLIRYLPTYLHIYLTYLPYLSFSSRSLTRSITTYEKECHGIGVEKMQLLSPFFSAQFSSIYSSNADKNNTPILKNHHQAHPFFQSFHRPSLYLSLAFISSSI